MGSQTLSGLDLKDLWRFYQAIGIFLRFVAPRVGQLHCIDPSSALAVARHALANQSNVQFHQASVAASGLPPNSQDFGTSLGVLHHVPDTAACRHAPSSAAPA